MVVLIKDSLFKIKQKLSCYLAAALSEYGIDFEASQLFLFTHIYTLKGKKKPYKM